MRGASACTAALIAGIATASFVIALPVPVELPEAGLYARTMLSSGVKVTDELADTATKALGSTNLDSAGTSKIPRVSKIVFKTLAKPSPPETPHDANLLSDAELLEVLLKRPGGYHAKYIQNLTDERVLKILPPPLRGGWNVPIHSPEEVAIAKRFANIRSAITRKRRKREAAKKRIEQLGATVRNGSRRMKKRRTTTKQTEQVGGTASLRSLVELLPPRSATAPRSARRGAPPSKATQASSEVPTSSAGSHNPSDALSLLADAAHQQSFKESKGKPHGNSPAQVPAIPPASPPPPRTPKEFEEKRQKMFVDLFGSASPPMSPLRTDRDITSPFVL